MNIVDYTPKEPILIVKAPTLHAIIVCLGRTLVEERSGGDGEHA